MTDEVALFGEPGPAATALASALRRAGLRVGEADGPALCRCAILLTFGAAAGNAVAVASRFATARTGTPRLIVLARAVAPKLDWPAAQDASLLAAFTRYAGLAYAGPDVRVNGIELRGQVPGEDIAAMVVAMWRWRSMTGQTVRLDVR